jgi:hypothetical protein
MEATALADNIGDADRPSRRVLFAGHGVTILGAWEWKWSAGFR